MYRNLAQIVEIGGGQQNIRITTDTFTYTEQSNGMAEITLPEEVSVTDCPEYACVYEPATMSGRVNFNDCFGVGFGSQSKGDYSYTGSAYKLLVQNMTTAPCCSVLMDAVAKQGGTYPDTMVHPSSTVLCMGSDDSSCGGDFGAPIYCRSVDTDELIVVAALTSTPCTSGDPILANDLTSGGITNYFG
ncbi:hypothetical protein Btru_047240 [Bulinus truncatus]|nr:hypothetical protein Btru_047240 [Bulinus truncatus]